MPSCRQRHRRTQHRRDRRACGIGVSGSAKPVFHREQLKRSGFRTGKPRSAAGKNTTESGRSISRLSPRAPEGPQCLRAVERRAPTYFHSFGVGNGYGHFPSRRADGKPGLYSHAAVKKYFAYAESTRQNPLDQRAPALLSCRHCRRILGHGRR